MRKIYAILLILAFVFIDANSQEEDPKVGRGFDTWTIGVGVPNTIVQGDLSSINEVSSSFLNPSYYVYINKNFSPIFGVEVKGQYLNLVGYSEPFDTSIENIAYNSGENLVFTGDTFGGEFNFRLNLSALKDKTLASNYIFSAYLGAGYHYYNSEAFRFSDSRVIKESYTPDDKLKRHSAYYTGGLGLQYVVSNSVNLELRQTFNVNMEDDFDAIVSDKSSKDYFHVTHLGLVFKLAQKVNDSDKDGIFDDVDECPQIPGIVENNGCPKDTDKDGIYDVDDSCIELAGVIENNGCPKDTDKDGVYDIDDECPEVAGIVENKGCPKDTDKDGVYDVDDACPTVAGSKENRGCPMDTDKDGVYDSEDACPKLAGVVENRGCPKDSDKDGVYDIDDLCPNVPGVLERKGCPKGENDFDYQSEEITLKDGKKARVIETVYFRINQHTLKPQGVKKLIAAVKKMREDPTSRFIISGNTDSGGNRAYNLKLSERRANTVRNFLKNQGVSGEKLEIIAYGFENPQYIENSLESKELNRRVEILLETGEEIEKLVPIDLKEAINENKTGSTDDGGNDNITRTATVDVIHVVATGETLFSLAKKYKVSVNEIRAWNKLRNNTIFKGNKLIVGKK